MRKAIIPSGLIGLALLALAQGCGTIEFSRNKSRENSPLSTEHQQAARKAEVLAQYSLGLIEQDSGNSAEAVNHYKAAVENDPENPELKLDLAVGLLHEGRHEEMDVLLDGLAKSNPDIIRTYQLKVLSLRLRGLDEEALIPLKKATSLAPGESVHYIERASIHLRSGRSDKAFDVLEDSLDIVTNRLTVFHSLGELYLRQAGDIIAEKKNTALPEKPLGQMTRAIQEFPKDTYLMNQYGDLLILHKRIEEAIDVFTRIEQLRPDDQQLRQKLALSLLSIGDRDRAIEMLEDIAEKRQTNRKLWLYLAELHEGNKNAARAIECLDKVIDLNPELPEGYIQKAYLLLSNNRKDEAQETLRAGTQSNPNDTRMIEMLAYVLMANSEYTNAVALFKRVESEMIKEDQPPLLSNFHLNYAVANQMIGAKETAAEILRKGIEYNSEIVLNYLQLALRNRDIENRLSTTLDVMELIPDITPENSVIYMLYGLIAFNAEQHEQAISFFEKTEQLAFADDDDEILTEQFYFWMGASSERLKQYDKAEEYFLDAISIQPDYAEAHNYLAYMHAERGVKLEMALDHIGVALAVSPDNPAFLDTRGWIYFQKGLFDDALIDLEEAVESMPNDPTISDHMGDLQKALGNDKQAAAWWSKSLAEDPSNEVVKQKLEAYKADRQAILNTEFSDEPDAPTGHIDILHLDVFQPGGPVNIPAKK